MFQFLGRNSGRSDALAARSVTPIVFVSIPRSEFWSFGHEGATGLPGHDDARFNSSVGILVVRTSSIPTAGCPTASFNSSVGILVVRTRIAARSTRRYTAFQFLGRNSGRSDAAYV